MKTSIWGVRCYPFETEIFILKYPIHYSLSVAMIKRGSYFLLLCARKSRRRVATGDQVGGEEKTGADSLHNETGAHNIRRQLVNALPLVSMNRCSQWGHHILVWGVSNKKFSEELITYFPFTRNWGLASVRTAQNTPRPTIPLFRAYFLPPERVYWIVA
jgi:hypothetical protein